MLTLFGSRLIPKRYAPKWHGLAAIGAFTIRSQGVDLIGFFSVNPRWCQPFGTFCSGSTLDSTTWQWVKSPRWGHLREDDEGEGDPTTSGSWPMTPISASTRRACLRTPTSRPSVCLSTFPTRIGSRTMVLPRHYAGVGARVGKFAIELRFLRHGIRASPTLESIPIVIRSGQPHRATLRPQRS